MAKRKKLEYDSEELTQNLKQSAGKGLDAFFPSSQSPTKESDSDGEKDSAQSPPSPSASETDSAETKTGESSNSEQKETTTQDNTNARTDEADVRTNVLFKQIPPVPQKRRPERYAFQFWADQITRLKKLNQLLNLTKDPEDRDEITLSDMVREAIDDYLTKQIDQTKKDVRSGE